MKRLLPILALVIFGWCFGYAQPYQSDILKNLSLLFVETSLHHKTTDYPSQSPYTVHASPAKGIFNLLMEGDYGQVNSIELYNLFGKCLFNSQLNTARHHLAGIPNGVYIVRIISEDKLTTCKITIGEGNSDFNRLARVELN